MKPWRTVATATHEGRLFTLKERGGEYLVQVDGKVLMGSRRHRSEELLATVGCERLKSGQPRVLIGGLGFGYTLRAALDALPKGAEVTVAEWSPGIVEWNRGELAALAGAPLGDSRTRVRIADVKAVLRKEGPFDAVLLDVDNGPVAVTREANSGLYDAAGVKLCLNALTPKGRLVVWSAGFDPRYERTLSSAGFSVSTQAVSASGADGARHVLFVADR